MAPDVGSVDEAVSRFGAAATSKLSAVSVRGEPEDQLRNPLEGLFASLCELAALNTGKLTLVGESSLAEMHTRPDFAVSYDNALVGYIEVKAPGKGADPRRFRDRHDKEQWKRLQALPNLVYTDGNSFSLWRDGELVGSIQHLKGDVVVDGAALRPSPGFLGLVSDFLRWSPTAPRSARQLAQTAARLCRLLRDEVTEQLDRNDPALTSLAEEWRHLLFPEATGAEFADGYAQAVTFGLLLARAEDIPLDLGIYAVAKKLGSSHSLIGTALRVLTDEAVQAETLATSVATLTRVLAVVDWPTLTKGDPEAWLYFYESFLSEYDPALRRKTGSYYTPPEVVKAMTRLVDESLRDRLDRPMGLADDSVTVVDPAMGTGTFLLSVIRSAADTLAQDLGKGAVPAALTQVLRRTIGFELQLGPFAVAQLRILAELVELGLSATSSPQLRTYVTNTLDNPYAEDEHLGMLYEPIARSRREANQIKKDEPVLVVIGNPPYRERSHGAGGWIEEGDQADSRTALMRDYIPPPDWGVGAHVKHLYNPYVYFWRWASWKVFEHHRDADRGVVCLITMAGFLDGPGFSRMRQHLRIQSDTIWVIDCSPEGHQPATNTRVFEAVQQPVCIVLALRDGSTGDQPAEVRVRTLASGNRQAKFEELAELSLTDGGWASSTDDPRGPFTAKAGDRWGGMPELDALLSWSGSGTMPGRTWVIAPDAETLRQRWQRLVTAKPEEKPDLMSEHEKDRRVDTRLRDNLPGYPPPTGPIGDESGSCPEPARIGYRSFDRQWIIPDKRLINRPNPRLWSCWSDQQVYLTALNRSSPSSGPGITFSALVPDQDHYKGSFSGRAYPLWVDADATTANVSSDVLAVMEDKLGTRPSGEDMFAYLATVCAHPGYTTSFAADLTSPGLRIPVTADRELFDEAVKLGRSVLWLHTFGQRFVDLSEDRPRRAPRVPQGKAPRVLRSIPSEPAEMPDSLSYDETKHHLLVGTGVVEEVSPAVWAYEVSGVRVLPKWFSYRRRSRERPTMGRRVSPLQEIQPDGWQPEYTSDLIDVLNVLELLVRHEPAQADLLARILEGPLVAAAEFDRTSSSGTSRHASGDEDQTMPMF